MKRARTIVVAAIAALSFLLPIASQAAAAGKTTAPAKSAASSQKFQANAPAPATKGRLLDAIRKRGVIRVGIAPQIPWVMRDPTGEWQGYEIDVTRQLA